MTQETDILNALSVIQDPDLHKDIVSLGFIKNLQISNESDVSFTIELTTPACPVKEDFKKQAYEAVRHLSWVREIHIELSSSRKPQASSAQKGLSKVANIIGVSSCKGGVGKSTVAVNLAYSLSKLGATVGIFDADIYGPSLPTMVDIQDPHLYLDGELLKPFNAGPVKLMSFGFVQHEDESSSAAMMRGPMVSQVINQLLTGTNWGELDYLVIDMPPGTGDIQLTLGQLIPMTAAVIVTTPQYISFIDVVKGIELFQTLKVPAIAVVENMSYYLCGSCQTKHAIFGDGAVQRLKKEFGFNHTFSFPILPNISHSCDNGVPYVIRYPEDEVSSIYLQLAETVAREVSKIKFGAYELPNISYDKSLGVLIKYDNQDGFYIPCKTLRLSCRCAKCQEEFTGKPLLDANSISNDIYPLSMNPVGNYALGINWSDQHSSLYPYDFLKTFSSSI